MDIEFVQHQNARDPDRQIIDINVIRIIADVIQDGVIAACLVILLELPPVAEAQILMAERQGGFVIIDKNIQLHSARQQMRKQSFAIIGDPRRFGVQRREIGKSHCNSAVKTASGNGTRTRNGSRSASSENHTSMRVSSPDDE